MGRHWRARTPPPHPDSNTFKRPKTRGFRPKPETAKTETISEFESADFGALPGRRPGQFWPKARHFEMVAVRRWSGSDASHRRTSGSLSTLLANLNITDLNRCHVVVLCALNGRRGLERWAWWIYFSPIGMVFDGSKGYYGWINSVGLYEIFLYIISFSDCNKMYLKKNISL